VHFRLRNVLAVFSLIVMAAFQVNIHKFLKVYLDHCSIFNLLKEYVAYCA
jgi:hypothetical protein